MLEQTSPISNDSPIIKYCKKKPSITLAQLPLVHTTDGRSFLEICRANRIKTSPDEPFNKNSLYFFYGRPAYRLSDEAIKWNDPSQYPICLVLKPQTVTGEINIYPFDTGAFIKGFYKGYRNPKMGISSFYLGNSLDIPPKIISTFFGDNRKYYCGEIRKDLDFSFSEMEARTYYAIITSPGGDPFDDRCYTMEIQTEKDLVIRKSLDVLAVIAPKSVKDDEEVRSYVENYWEAPILDYPTFGYGNPAFFTVSVWNTLMALYEEDNLL